MKSLWNRFWNWLGKYPAFSHFIFIVWNAFITSWATKTSIPLTEIDLPYNMNASIIVSWLQAHAHIKTSYIAVFTFFLNAAIFYTSWKKKHSQIVSDKAKDVAIETQQLADEAKEVAKTAVTADKQSEKLNDSKA